MSPIPKSLRKLLGACVQCKEHCSRIRLAPNEGAIPRGFCYGSGRTTEKELFLIFPEPHTNRESPTEQDRYRQARRSGGWERVVEEVDSVTREYFARGEARSGFHTRTMDLLKEVFGTQDEIFRHCYFTELTKCEKENDSRGILLPTREKCLDLYLKRELEIIKPKAVVLFGLSAFTQFTRRGEPLLVRLIDEILGRSGRTILAEHPSRASVCKWLRNPDRERLVNNICLLLERTKPSGDASERERNLADRNSYTWPMPTIEKFPPSPITRDSVLKAIEQFDRIGRAAFLEKFAKGRGARRGHTGRRKGPYFVAHNGNKYDATALVRAARFLQDPDRHSGLSLRKIEGPTKWLGWGRLGPDHWSSGIETLKLLGFKVP